MVYEDLSFGDEEPFVPMVFAAALRRRRGGLGERGTGGFLDDPLKLDDRAG